jgi:PAS domain S-box-containing protein/diguanylate cyclase (GGDEF)-like protein
MTRKIEQMSPPFQDGARGGESPDDGRPVALDFASAFDAAGFGVVITDPRQADNPIVRVNPAFLALTGYAADDVIGRNCRFLQGPGTDPVAVAEIHAAIEEGQPINRVLLNYRKDGTPFWNKLTLSPLRASSGDLIGFVGIQSDVTDQRRREDEAKVWETRLQSLLDHIPGFLFQRVQRPGRAPEFLYCSNSLNRLLGLPNTSLSYAEFLSHIHPDDVDQVNSTVVVSGETFSPSKLTYRMLTASGQEIWIQGAATPREGEGGATVWDGWGMDVTSERLANTRLAYLTHHDLLTGLENRARFERGVDEAVKSFDQRLERLVLYSVEIDEFEEIRDALGQSVAEALLRAVGQRLAAFVGPTGRVGRLGEAQFGVLEARNTRSPPETGARLQADLMRPIGAEGRVLKIQPDIGLAFLPGGEGDRWPHGGVARELIKRAELARIEGRRTTPGLPTVYSREFDDRIADRVKLRQSLHRAVANGEFEVHYQPLVDLRGRKIVGAEALVRWRHPELGLQRPDVFIPLAEESGLIVPLGEWVLEQAMRQALHWDRPEFGSPKIAVNVSGAQLKRSDFLGTVKRLLDLTKVDPARIELELTEGFLIGTTSQAVDALHGIRDLGVNLVIDDFGTGYSSFEYLKTLPFDKLKIDQSFIRHLVNDSNGAAIVRAIIEMARSLRLTVICEGIETRRQLEFLRRQGCETGQGYLFAPPLAADAFEGLLVSRRSGTPFAAFASPAALDALLGDAPG